MHSAIYRTELLRETGLKLPEHCFYVDNIFVYVRCRSSTLCATSMSTCTVTSSGARTKA